MTILLTHIISTALVWVASFVPFTDAEEALRQGVFSATTVVGYSVGKAVILYVLFIALGGLFGLIASVRHKTADPVTTVASTKGLPRLSGGEWRKLLVVLILLGFANVFFAERVFDSRSFTSEEFYNLGGLVELQSGEFDMLFPYSFGNLIMLDAASSIGMSLPLFKGIFHPLLLFILYLAIAAIIPTPKHRWRTFLFVLLLYLQPILSPTLHRNVFRFVLPFVTLAVTKVVWDVLAASKQRWFLGVTGVYLFVLWAGTADTIVVSSVVYGVFTLLKSWQQRDWRLFVLGALAPLVAVIISLGVTGGQYLTYLGAQLGAITAYSGFVNTNPYLNILTAFPGESVWKTLSEVLIYYLPIVVMFQLVYFLARHWRSLPWAKHEWFVYIAALTPAYFIYHRQTFGDAGIGRIGIAAAILIFITMCMRQMEIRPGVTAVTYRLSQLFFLTILAVSMYFFRYSAMDLYQQTIAHKDAATYVRCDETFLAERLTMIGYEWCERALVDELSELDSFLSDEAYYVYDDTFSLYYLLGGRPVTLIPSYSMSHDGQADILDAMARKDVRQVLKAKHGHFFGVPEGAEADDNFMHLVRAEIATNFLQVGETDHFVVYQKN